jgi:hypothetical protein
MGEQYPKKTNGIRRGRRCDGCHMERPDWEDTGLVVAKPGRRRAWRQARAGGRRIQSWWYSQLETSI